MHCQRTQQLKQWLDSLFPDHDFHLEIASADASFRRYFRLYHTGQTFIIMDAPPDKEALEPFMSIAQSLREHGAHAPKLHEFDQAQGFLILEDFGSEHYLDHLNADSVDKLYRQALQAIVQLQHGNSSNLPPYDRELLHKEMRLFPDWLLKVHWQISLTPTQEALITQQFNYLSTEILKQPTAFVHRDFHSRNLMLTAENSPGIIDFQDAVCGPITYDAVSLLRDCYVRWPKANVQRWALQFRDMAVKAGNFAAVSDEQFLAWFDLMGIQRHLKAAGIFARLNHRDGKAGYLPDIPRTVEYLLDITADYPALAPLQQLFSELNIAQRINP